MKNAEDMGKEYVDKEKILHLSLSKTLGAKLKEQESRFVKKHGELSAQITALKEENKRLNARYQRTSEAKNRA